MREAVGIEESLGNESINVRMKIEVLAEGVEGEKKGGKPFGLINLQGSADVGVRLFPACCWCPTRTLISDGISCERAKLWGRLSVSLPHAKTRRRKWGEEEGQNCGTGYLFLSESKLRGRLPVTGYLCFTSPPTLSARRCRA